VPEIKAIETRYKGYRFRSRLEARYAVLFDFLKLKWEYEPEGYIINCPHDFGNGSSDCYYLPDFRINDFNWFVEVKAEGRGFLRGEDGEIDGLGNFATIGRLSAMLDIPVLMLEGTPEPNLGLRLYKWEEVQEPYIPLYQCSFVSISGERFEVYHHTGLINYLASNNLNDAIIAARSARFEHGESG
jgi:hypothetical protein